MTDKTTPVVEQQRRWLKIAKSAGDHGVRYRTNRALEAFMREVVDEFRDHMQPAKADALREALFNLQQAASSMITGIWIHNDRKIDRHVPIEGPVIVALADAERAAREALKATYAALQSTPEQPSATPPSPTPASPSLEEVERVEIDRPFMLAAARAWWAVHMGGNVRAINITGDGRVKVAWSDADESGHYTLPVDFLTALSAPASATSERETFASINQWCDDTFGPATIPQIIQRAKEEFDELEEDGADHAIEASDVVICLCRIPGFAEALQRKMAINRGRKWRLTGNGTGYHIPDAIERGDTR